MKNLVSSTALKDQLVAKGLKATQPRIVILRALLEYDGHPTAERVFSVIREDNPTISLTSVHRILDDLVEAGLASRVSAKNGLKRYDGNQEPHNHIYCLKSDRIQDYVDEELNQIIKDYFDEKRISNFKITDFKLLINGERHDPDKPVFIS